MNIGKVYLVGAGPGDPDLITRKALRLLQGADVVMYDRLIPPSLLDETRADSELVDVGKGPTRHRLSQDKINALIIKRALCGLTVVRLKGGDPLVFGRGGEEALVCADHGIPFEIVPGVSSAFAVPAYAGIPLTHRHVSSSFSVIAGHEDPRKRESGVNYRALAQMGGTIVILMGVGRLRAITSALMEHGLDGATPAAIIEWGTLQRQRSIVSDLASIADRAVDAAIQPPAISVIGEVVKLRQAGLRWFDLLPAELLAETHDHSQQPVGAFS